MYRTIALFGEAERGEFHAAYYVKSLKQLVEMMGNPPAESKGLHYAVQALLLDWSLIFFRVKDEGFSRDDYFRGFNILENKELFPSLTALFLPGMGDAAVLDATIPLCRMHQSLLLTTEADLYDYLTSIH